MAAEHNPLTHVVDHNNLELPWFGEVGLPNIFGVFQVTRFMVMEIVASCLIVLVIVPLVRHIAKNPVTHGRFWNLFEMFVLFIRDGVARPVIDGNHADHGHEDAYSDHHHGHGNHGHIPNEFDPSASEIGLLGGAPGISLAKPKTPHTGRDSDLFMPFLWTMFFFILFNNLLGMFPGGASATGNINVTGMLALMTLIVVLFAGMRASGVGGFFKNIVPKIDAPALLKPPIWGMLFLIEVVGLLIRHIVLSVRLFANMLAGHIVLAVIMGFVTGLSGSLLYMVTSASVLGGVAISLLELFVAFLQAYIFTFLASLFIGSAAHPH
jgi:F-type H+-transporting ATPase subunit a